MRNFLTVSLVFCLILQLTAISISFPAPDYTFGSTVNRIFTAKKQISIERPRAILAGESARDYESIVFVGDVMLARNVEYLMEEKGKDYPFTGFDIANLRPHSAIFGNFEASIPEVHETTPAGSLKFSVKDSSVDLLKDVGFTHLSLGNNHSFDYGSEGYENTLKSFAGSGISALGNEMNIDKESIEYINVDDKRIAVIAINLLMQPKDTEVRNLISYARENSDLQIAYVHWGEEYDLHHSKQQEQQAKVMVEAGIDLIVGHHPHVTQDIGIVEGVPVFYSLGNYIFDQYFSKDVQEGLVLTLSYDDGFEIDIIPVSSKGSLSQPRLMSPDNHVDFLASLARKSDILVQKTIAEGRINLQNSVASSTKMAIINQ